jgi:hypothetical protein
VITRREALLASAALPVAAAVANVPLTSAALRVLAMCATPRETWEGREDDYFNDPKRIAKAGTTERQIIDDLEAQGLVVLEPTPWLPDMAWAAEATLAGREVLRKAGVLA